MLFFAGNLFLINVEAQQENPIPAVAPRARIAGLSPNAFHLCHNSGRLSVLAAIIKSLSHGESPLKSKFLNCATVMDGR
jgi:hypothetical protein